MPIMYTELRYLILILSAVLSNSLLQLCKKPNGFEGWAAQPISP